MDSSREIIVKNSDEDFDVLYNLLKFYQRNTTVKSKVDIYKDSNEIDFKLKDGICKSMNASILMKKIGIEM